MLADVNYHNMLKNKRSILPAEETLVVLHKFFSAHPAVLREENSKNVWTEPMKIKYAPKISDRIFACPPLPLKNAQFHKENEH